MQDRLAHGVAHLKQEGQFAARMAQSEAEMGIPQDARAEIAAATDAIASQLPQIAAGPAALVDAQLSAQAPSPVAPQAPSPSPMLPGGLSATVIQGQGGAMVAITYGGAPIGQIPLSDILASAPSVDVAASAKQAGHGDISTAFVWECRYPSQKSRQGYGVKRITAAQPPPEISVGGKKGIRTIHGLKSFDQSTATTGIAWYEKARVEHPEPKADKPIDPDRKAAAMAALGVLPQEPQAPPAAPNPFAMPL